MKKYIIKDEEGKVVEVSEEEINEQPKPEAPKKDEEPAAAAPFTPEQMDAIRKIISEELAKAKEPAPAPETHDEEEMKKEEEKKMETEDSKKAKDSVKGPVSLEEKKVEVKDSSLDEEEERNNAFAKRYGISR